MGYTLGQAAKATGKSKPTISRAIKSSKITASKDIHGQYDIDPAALHAVYPPVSSSSNAANDTEQSVTPIETPNNDKALEREIELLREMLDDVKADRDSWKQQAQKVTALIEDKREDRGIMARLFGKK